MGWVLVTFVLAVSALLQQRSPVVEGARIKIHLSEEFTEVRVQRLKIRQTIQTACSDKVELNKTNTGLPSSILNTLDNRVRYFSSAAAKQNIEDTIFTRVVPSLRDMGETTVRDVFNVLQQGNCYSFFYGGIVRDQFLGKPSADVDLEADCEIHQVYSICNKSWGEMNCKVNESTGIAHIGVQVNSPDDAIDAASINSTFFANLSALEYTVNSLAYDLNGINNVIVDLSGKGVDDVCSNPMIIRIPSDDNSVQSWDVWRQVQGGTTKVYRFWKLRVKGFVPFNDQILEYIVQHAKNAIESDPKSFKKFYCKTVYGGAKYDSTMNACNITEQTCRDKAATASNYMLRYSEDFGDYYSTLQTKIPIAICGSAPLYSSLVLIAIGVVLSGM